MFKKSIGSTKLQSHIAKKRKTNPFWLKLNSQTVQEICQRFILAKERFFKGKAKRLPKFKKPKSFASIVFKQSGYQLFDNQITINSIKKTFKFSLSREYKNVKNIRIKRNSMNEFFICFVCDVKPNTFKTRDGAIGIDFGLSQYITGSDGLKVDSPLFFKQYHEHLAKAQKELSTKVKGSNNRNKAKLKVARVHKRISNLRDDFGWKLAHKLCKNYSYILLEDLNIEAMKRLWGKKVSDLSHSAFLSKLEHIATKYKTVVHKIDRWFPSSKQCFSCGNIKKDLELKDRVFVCECGYSECRDKNAALNILREGILSLERSSQTSFEALPVCIQESHAL